MPLSLELTRDAVSRLVNADNPSEQRKCLVSNADQLLTSEAATLLHELVQKAATPAERTMARRASRLISWAHSEGLFSVLIKLVPITPDVVMAVQQYLASGSWLTTFKYLVGNQDVLTSALADIWMEDLTLDKEITTNMQGRLRACRQLAQIARDDGINGARSWLVVQLTRYVGESNPAVRIDAKATILALAPMNLPEWCEMLDSYANELIALSDPRVFVEDAIAIIGDELLPGALRTNLPMASFSCRLALGALYQFRFQGERSHNFSLAVDILNEALHAVPNDAGDEQLARLHLLLGKAISKHFAHGRVTSFKRAIDHLSIASKYFEALTDYNHLVEALAIMADCAHDLSTLYVSKGEKQTKLFQVIQHLEKLTTMTKEPALVGRVNAALARAYVGCVQFEPHYCSKALDSIEAAINATSPSDAFVWALNRVRYGEIAICQRQLDLSFSVQRAIDRLEEAATSFEKQSLWVETCYSWELLGDLQLYNADWAAAAASYKRLVGLGEELFEAAFTMTGRETAATSASMVAAKLGYCLCRLSRPAEALIEAEKFKLRTVLEALQYQQLIMSDVSPAVKERLRNALSEVQKLETEARLSDHASNRRSEAMIGEQLHTARQNLKETTAAEFHRGKCSIEELTESRVRTILYGARLVVPFISPIGTALLILPPDCESIQPMHVHYTPLTLEQVLEMMGTYVFFLNAVRTDRKKAIDMLAVLTKRIWMHLMSDVVNELTAQKAPAGSEIVFVSHAGLGALPIHAAECPTTRRVLLQDYTISAVPSLALLVHCAERKVSGPSQIRRQVGIIDPGKNLPFARLEAELLLRCPQVPDCVMLVGENATYNKVLSSAATATHLHFACHGDFNFAAPWRSGLIMTDGTLSADDIASAERLVALELVTISACETGVYDVRHSPDEYEGITAGFLLAGASSVVSTLWSVADPSAALLMGDFYRRYWADRASVKLALRGAQLWLRSVQASQLLQWIQEQLNRSRAGKPFNRAALRALWRLRQTLRQMKPEELPFVGPQHWASFVALTVRPICRESGDRPETEDHPVNDQWSEPILARL